ncbi:MAG TPA: radical SAM family heme chaperone HemW, partial [Vicinamibacteria bacterium]|nr:radical SAM family heme chaperone HemW [Vicinamibacteria bacterium]
AIDPRRPPEERQERYARALLAEIGASAPEAADTLHLGGGTPSLMSLEWLERVVEAARSRFSLAGAEITLEANPKDLGPEGYRRLRAIGVNRLSLGVQSVDPGVLKAMGRLHSADDAYRAFDGARGAGFDNVSLDFILGWPGETQERWERNLRAVEDLSPDHVSLYVLEVEGKTVLGHEAQKGRLALPEDELVATLYWETVAALERVGLRRYEISNFAREQRESRHNLKYWDDQEFLGFGQAAHSYRGAVRSWNAPTFVSYCRGIEESGRARVGERILTPEDRIGEALFTGLRRREGVDLARFSCRYGVNPLTLYAAGLAPSFEAGLVELQAGWLRLTERGVLLSNEVFRAFV